MILLWLVMILIAIAHVPGILRRQHYRTLMVFVGLWIFSGVYTTLLITRFPLPDIIDFLIRLVTP